MVFFMEGVWLMNSGQSRSFFFVGMCKNTKTLLPFRAGPIRRRRARRAPSVPPAQGLFAWVLMVLVVAGAEFQGPQGMTRRSASSAPSLRLLCAFSAPPVRLLRALRAPPLLPTPFISSVAAAEARRCLRRSRSSSGKNIPYLLHIPTLLMTTCSLPCGAASSARTRTRVWRSSGILSAKLIAMVILSIMAD